MPFRGPRLDALSKAFFSRIALDLLAFVRGEFARFLVLRSHVAELTFDVPVWRAKGALTSKCLRAFAPLPRLLGV